MAESKYGKHIITDPYYTHHQTESFNVRGDQLDVECIITSQGIYEPFVMVTEPHKHFYREIFCFVGGDPTNIRDFGAEIEMCIGEEEEKHIITTNTALSIPPNLPHCPLNFKKIDKPIVFLLVILGTRRVDPTGMVQKLKRADNPKMTGNKYGKHITSGSYKKFYQTEAFSVNGELLNTDCVVATQGIYEPFVMIEEAHKHPFHQIFGFVGGDPTNIRDFGAEIELCLGEEEEKHVITTNTAVSIPPGLYHCPLNFKRIDKPIVFLQVMLGVRKIDASMVEVLKK
jgi:mannose-6-phosphate isomerase-like protein (cupin superfamily)